MVSRRLLAQTLVAKLLAEPTQRSKWLQATAAYLIDHKQTKKLELFMNDVAHELLLQNGQLDTEIISARPLGANVLADLQNYLKVATGASTVNVQTSQEPALLGGFVARTADAEINKSIQYQLSQLRGIA